MKRFVYLFVVLFVMTMLFSGCGSTVVNLDQIESIEVYTGGVPSDARKKRVTEKKDIENIIKKAKKMKVTRKAKSADILSGGIGINFKVNFNDGISSFFTVNDKLLSFEGETYVVNKSFFDENFYIGLEYEEIKVDESELYSSATIRSDYFIKVEKKEIPLTAESIKYTVVNNTEETVYFLNIPMLEKNVNGEWKSVGFKENVGFCGTADTVEKTYESKVSLDIYEGLTKGEYRIFVKRVDGENKEVEILYDTFRLV